jgi:hypothetical protein
MTTEETLPAPRRGGNWHQYLSETRVRCMRRAVLGTHPRRGRAMRHRELWLPLPDAGGVRGPKSALRSVARFIPSTKGRARFLV